MTARPTVIDHDYGRMVVTEERMRSAPLGVRATGSITGHAVRGLTAQSWPDPASVAGPTIVRLARESSEGILGFATLPTTREAERGAVPDFDPATTQFVRLDDPRRRWLPQLVTFEVPIAGVQETIVFPTPSYIAEPGYVIVRATLRHELAATSGPEPTVIEPAAHAALSIAVSGFSDPFVGIADGQGEAAVLIPFPEPTAGTPLAEQTASAALEVRFNPGLAIDPIGRLPLLADILSQPLVEFAGEPSLPIELTYGTDTVAEHGGPSIVLLDAA